MWFESDVASLEISIGGYSDRPWYFKTEQIGVNALECQAIYENRETGRNFIMWDELFQTDEIIAIRDGFRGLLSGTATKFAFHSEYETFAITILSAEAGFEAVVQVQDIDGNVMEPFCLSRADLEENSSYLSTCCEKYPVREVQSEGDSDDDRRI